MTKKRKKQRIIKLLHKKVAVFSRRVAPIYQALKWEWCGGGRNEGRIIPDAVDIAISIEKMLNFLERKEYFYISTGGITVEIEEDKEINELVGRIKFDICEEIHGDEKE